MKTPRLAFVFALLLSSCATPASPPETTGYTSPLDKITLDVKDLTFVDRGIDQTPAGTVVHFQPTIADALHNWVAQRLQAAGGAGIAAFVVKNAYVTEDTLPSDSSWFEREQASKLTGHVEVEFDARGRQGYALATANAARSVTLPENPSDGERQDAYNHLMSGMMQDLDKYLDQAIHEHMKDFIIDAPVIGSKLPPPESPNQAP